MYINASSSEVLKKVTISTTLRAYIFSFEVYPFPRKNVVNNSFFDYRVGAIISMSSDELEREIRYIIGLGPTGKKILLEIIYDLCNRDLC